MTAISATAALQGGVEAVTREAGGMMEIAVIRPSDIPGLLGEALAGSADARMLLRLFHDTTAKIAAAPAKGRPLCVACPRELQRGYSVAAAIPARDSPHQAVALAVCPRCGPSRDAIMALAMDGLRRIWPEMRPVSVTHTEGGRA